MTRCNAVIDRENRVISFSLVNQSISIIGCIDSDGQFIHFNWFTSREKRMSMKVYECNLSGLKLKNKNRRNNFRSFAWATDGDSDFEKCVEHFSFSDVEIGWTKESEPKKKMFLSKSLWCQVGTFKFLTNRSPFFYVYYVWTRQKVWYTSTHRHTLQFYTIKIQTKCNIYG